METNTSKGIKFLDATNTSQTYDILSMVISSWGETEKNQIQILNINVRE